jgi:hypothetical protein
MKISFPKLIDSIPMLKSAIDGLISPGASKSKTVWYNLLKALFTVLAAAGIYTTLTSEDIESISAVLAVSVPAILTLIDMVVNMWLRKNTIGSLQDKVGGNNDS